ncbi:hypothetical protein LUZ60_015303 [Juncus effusus]|nr:hypothetical protein LUZ60_015303 [Juncus effusus]
MEKGGGEAPTIAVDLGTTWTRAAVCRDGAVETIAVVPSYVAFTTNGGILIGESAVNQAAVNPLNTIFDANRLIGRNFTDPLVQINMKLWPFKIVSDQHNKPLFSIQQHGEERHISPEEICSMILIHIKEISESYLGYSITNAVINLPIYYNHLQKQAIKDAGSIAGLSVRLVSSCMTAVTNYNFENYSFEKSYGYNENVYNVLFFNLGGGALNVSVITCDNGVYEVKSACGDVQLGGEDFDNRIIDYFIYEFKKKYKLDISGDPRALSRLRTACERAKINLSNNNNGNITSIGIISLHNGIDFHSTISKTKFEELNLDLFERCIECVDKCIKESTIDVRNISEIILVGGSTKIPKLQFMLQNYFNGNAIFKSMKSQDESIINGTAVLSAVSNNDKNEKIQDLIVLNVTHFSYGIEIGGGLMVVLLSKNTTIPTRKEMVFPTDHDKQNCFSVRVYEGERIRVLENNFLGEFELLGIPFAQKGVQKIHVCFDIDAKGTLIVSAENKVGKVKNNIVFNINTNYNDINNSNQNHHGNSSSIREDDEESIIRLKEAKYSLLNYIESIKESIIKEEISSQDKLKIKEAIDLSINWINNNEFAKTEDFITKLDELERIYNEIVEKINSFGTENSIGIDFGTAYSCVGVWINQHVEIVSNEQGSRITPSCIAFNENERLIGDLATHQSSMNPTNTIFDIKRLIGRHYSDPSVQNDIKSSPFIIKQDLNDRPNIIIQYKGKEKLLLPEELTSMIFLKTKEISETHTNTVVQNAVIAVPSYFSNSQRLATRNAAKIAGLNVIRMINETTATAIAYHSQKMTIQESSIEKNVFVFDLGGGFLDTSVVNINNGTIKVISNVGNVNLGGEEFDKNMVSHFVEEFNNKEGIEISINPRSMRKLKNACEKAKRVLSTVSKTSIEIDSLFDGIDFCSGISREEFEEINLDLFQICLETVESCLDEANFDKSEIDDVVLVGSSTRIPKIQQLLQEFFNGKELCKSVNPDEAIAYGATILATNKTLQIDDVIATTLGLETASGDITILIPRNTKIPTNKQHIFTTNSDYQTSISIHLWACETGCLLGKFDIIDIIPRLRGLPKICVLFNVDINGILSLKAYDITRASERIELKCEEISCRLSNQEIEKLMTDLEEYKLDDEENIKRIEAKNKLEDYAYKVREIAKDAKKLYFTERRKINRVVDQAINWLDSEQFAETAEFEEKLVELKRVCEALIH